MNPLVQLGELGQSVWLDQMRRSLLTTGELKKLIRDDGVKGLTSNPTIFEKAISGSPDYADALRALAQKGSSVSEIYEALVIEDIGNAADLFREVYDANPGGDGFVSLEVSPLLAHDTAATIKEAKSLFSRLNRPNVMIKVPGTPEGLPAIEELIAAGLNINVTLIFSVEVYEKVTEAYIRGLEKRAAAGQPVDKIGSVASFFVSRIDTTTDKQLDNLAKQVSGNGDASRITALKGKAAIANAKLAYESFQRIFGGERFAAMKAKGAKVQRPLWASTSTKNPAYSDVMYVEELIGSDTVDTMPPQTIDAYRDHGKPARTLDTGLADAHKLFADLKAVGVDFREVTEQLTKEGVASFADSFQQLIKVIEARREEACTGILDRHTASLGLYEAAYADNLKKLDGQHFAARMWQRDASLWKSEPEHQDIIKNALGWLGVVEKMTEHVKELKSFAHEIRDAGFEHVVVLGMGGSSLCPEVFRRTLGKQKNWPELHVLDSTVPSAVRLLEQRIRSVEKALFMVSSKSGTTTEPDVFRRYFFDRVKHALGDEAGRNFVAITDPGTQLQKEAERDHFRRVFLNPSDIGGRYSALSYFGLVPLALMGGDVAGVLNRATHAIHACAGEVPSSENPAVRMGAAIGTLALAGRDKLTFVTPTPLDSLGLWIEQLIAESTGKEGKGIIPIAGEPLGSPEVYGDDRVFVYIHTQAAAPPEIESQLQALEAAGHPVLRSKLHDPLDLGEEFFLWEFATPVAGALLGIDPFDQPNVQESKDNTKRLLAEYKDKGTLTQQAIVAADRDVRIFADAATKEELRKGSSNLSDVLAAHLRRIHPHDYVAITEYFEERDRYDALLQQLRKLIRDHNRIATTTGYGPRFLHSTGQLHKGGPESGVFIQVTCEDVNDVAIPGEPFTFSILKQAQALGDFESLSKRHRRAIRLDIGRNIEEGLKRVLQTVQAVLSQSAAVEAGAPR